MTILIPSSNIEPQIYILHNFVCNRELQTKRNWTLQSELLHCNSKASYMQTNKKKCKKQLAQMEGRHVWIHHIWQKFLHCPMTNKAMTSANNQYEIGFAEKFPEYIPQFLNKNAGDPAIKTRTSHHISNYLFNSNLFTGLLATTWNPPSTMCSGPSAISYQCQILTTNKYRRCINDTCCYNFTYSELLPHPFYSSFQSNHSWLIFYHRLTADLLVSAYMFTYPTYCDS